MNKQHVTDFERQTGYDLPRRFKEFLLHCSGSEMFETSDATARIIKPANLVNRNRVYEVQAYEPEYIMFAQDGDIGLFLKRDGSEIIYQNDLGALGSLEMQPVAKSIEELVSKSRGDTADDQSKFGFGSIICSRKPDNIIKFISIVRKKLKVAHSISTLKAMLDNCPTVIISNVRIVSYVSCVNEINEEFDCLQFVTEDGIVRNYKL